MRRPASSPPYGVRSGHQGSTHSPCSRARAMSCVRCTRRSSRGTERSCSTIAPQRSTSSGLTQGARRYSPSASTAIERPASAASAPASQVSPTTSRNGCPVRATHVSRARCHSCAPGNCARPCARNANCAAGTTIATIAQLTARPHAPARSSLASRSASGRSRSIASQPTRRKRLLPQRDSSSVAVIAEYASSSTSGATPTTHRNRRSPVRSGVAASRASFGSGRTASASTIRNTPICASWLPRKFSMLRPHASASAACTAVLLA